MPRYFCVRTLVWVIHKPRREVGEAGRLSIIQARRPSEPSALLRNPIDGVSVAIALIMALEPDIIQRGGGRGARKSNGCLRGSSPGQEMSGALVGGRSV